MKYCSFKGTCDDVAERCICFHGFEGAQCTSGPRKLKAGELITDTLQNTDKKFYGFAEGQYHFGDTIVVELKTGDVQVYGGLGFVPEADKIQFVPPPDSVTPGKSKSFVLGTLPKNEEFADAADQNFYVTVQGIGALSHEYTLVLDTKFNGFIPGTTLVTSILISALGAVLLMAAVSAICKSAKKKREAKKAMVAYPPGSYPSANIAS